MESRKAVFVSLLLLTSIANAQPPSKALSIPFRTINGMIFVDAAVNGHATSLLFETGANSSIVSPQVAGLTAVQFRALQATKAGTGAEGDYIVREVDLRLDRHHWLNRRVLVMDLSDASKLAGIFERQDRLQEPGR